MRIAPAMVLVEEGGMAFLHTEEEAIWPQHRQSAAPGPWHAPWFACPTEEILDMEETGTESMQVLQSKLRALLPEVLGFFDGDLNHLLMELPWFFTPLLLPC